MKKIILLSAIAFVLAGCFSTWEGDNGTFTVSIGSSAGNGRALVNYWPDPDKPNDTNDLTHKITLSGVSGPEQTKSVTNTEKTVHFSVAPGNWDISVKAYRKDGGKDILTAVGFASVKIKLGPNDPVPIKMGDMALIPAGTFTMGSPANEPGREKNETQHKVTLTKDFYIGKYPVTQAQYEAVMGETNNPSLFKNPVSPEKSTANRPVESVSWYDAIVFCNRLSMKEEGLTPAYSINGETDPARWGAVPTSSNEAWNAVVVVADSNGYRLPTEAQWEYACRAGTTTAFNWGRDIINSTKANYPANIVDSFYNTRAGESLKRTTEVANYKPNAWGLYDMHGNVREWCWDRFDVNYGGKAGDAVTDPKGPDSGAFRIAHGGAYNSLFARHLRSAYRHNNSSPDTRLEGTGFRLVRPFNPGNAE